MGRSFYENDGELVVSKPGAPTTEISNELKKQESVHGDISFVDGMVVRTTPYLEKYMNKLRLLAHDKLALVETELSTAKSATTNELNLVAREVEDVIKEPVLPNLIYILTLTLTGSIIVRNRSLPVRFAVPTAFAAASTAQFMPKTYDTLVGKYDAWEKKTLPEVNEQRAELWRAYYAHKRLAKEYVADAQVDLQRQVHNARVYAEKLLDE